MIGDTLVTICPWWDGPLGRAALERQLAADAARRPARWVWVYHWPPLGSPTCWTGRRHYGDADLGGWIAQHRPDIVLTGHVHEPPFKPDGSWADRIGDTWVFNAGRQIGPVPAHIEIDLGAGSACVALDDGRGDAAPARTPRRRERTVFEAAPVSTRGRGRGPSPGGPAAPGAAPAGSARRTPSTGPGASPYWCFRSAR